MAIKTAVSSAGVWGGLCPHWFINLETNKPLILPERVVINELLCASVNGFEPHFKVYASFYSDENIYSIVEPPSCTLLDVALAKGRPEAIAECFYTTMRSQQQNGGQSNDTLLVRTALSWSLPVKQCHVFSTFARVSKVVNKSAKEVNYFHRVPQGSFGSESTHKWHCRWNDLIIDSTITCRSALRCESTGQRTIPII